MYLSAQAASIVRVVFVALWPILKGTVAFLDVVFPLGMCTNHEDKRGEGGC